MTAGLSARIALTRGSLPVDVSLEIAPGETLAVLGANGSGKTTVLHAIAGLLAIDRGSVAVAGRVVTDLAPEQRNIGVVFQDHRLFPHLSARQNVAFGLRARGRPRGDARRVAAEWLDRVGVLDHADVRPQALSAGQAQRVALARALAIEPDVLLLDEPFASLDADACPELRNLVVAAVRRTKAACVVVTHDPADVERLADRSVTLVGGRVVQPDLSR